MFPLNLVPICGPCNKRKSASSETDINKAFIHPYLDTIPAVTFYQSNVIRSNGTYNVTFQFLPGAISDAVLAKRMAYQLKRIKLNDRLSSEVTEVLNEFALTLALFELEFGPVEGSLDIGLPEEPFLPASQQEIPACGAEHVAVCGDRKSGRPQDNPFIDWRVYPAINV
ncbi:hypothetical protein [Sphingomonas sp.]|jgi:hypothetical protein|uniref:hypothetical protein n=1 Tax=Sphingomonas sp. TaxID=28214 RepID=UPI002E33BA9F|nr:hypothetical protein [Sphingomonas sp.]HEX4695617.1 hypothetical protein [Sphingomonas sp.]